MCTKPQARNPANYKNPGNREAGRPAQVLGLQHRCVGRPLAATPQRRIQEAP